MCYTTHASLVSFAANVITSSVLYLYSKSIALFYIFVSLMQLYDFIFWTYSTKNRLNYWVTKLAMIKNHLQPVVLALLIVYFDKKTLTPTSKVILGLYIGAAIIYSIYTWYIISYTFVSKMDGGSLFWEWNHTDWTVPFYTLFAITIAVIFYENYPWPVNVFAGTLALVSMLMAGLYFKTRLVGRFWCWIAGFMPLLIAAFYHFVMRR